MASPPKFVARFRQPEYTGANRCLPCTTVNVFIAAVIASALAVASLWAGVVAFAVFAGVIYLRGYLVPGTPEFTKQYFPASVLRLFGKQAPVGRGSTVGVEAESIQSGESSFEGNVVTRNESDVLDLTSDFGREWTDRILVVREHGIDSEDVRAMFDAGTISRHGGQSFVVDGNKLVRWGSEAALVADVAAAEVLRERFDGWTAFDREQRQSVLMGLRLCLQQCPSCDGPLDVTEDRVDPCCDTPHLVAQSVCRDCGAAVADAAVVDRGEGGSVRERLLRP